MTWLKMKWKSKKNYSNRLSNQFSPIRLDDGIPIMEIKPKKYVKKTSFADNFKKNAKKEDEIEKEESAASHRRRFRQRRARTTSKTDA